MRTCGALAVPLAPSTVCFWQVLMLFPGGTEHSVNVCGLSDRVVLVKMLSLGWSVTASVSQMGCSYAKILICSTLEAAKAPACHFGLQVTCVVTYKHPLGTPM